MGDDIDLHIDGKPYDKVDKEVLRYITSKALENMSKDEILRFLHERLAKAYPSESEYSNRLPNTGIVTIEVE